MGTKACGGLTLQAHCSCRKPPPATGAAAWTVSLCRKDVQSPSCVLRTQPWQGTLGPPEAQLTAQQGRCAWQKRPPPLPPLGGVWVVTSPLDPGWPAVGPGLAPPSWPPPPHKHTALRVGTRQLLHRPRGFASFTQSDTGARGDGGHSQAQHGLTWPLL